MCSSDLAPAAPLTAPNATSEVPVVLPEVAGATPAAAALELLRLRLLRLLEASQTARKRRWPPQTTRRPL